MNEDKNHTNSVTPWSELGLSPELVNFVTQAGFQQPTPVQERAIPQALDGVDLMVSAQTGTGKTAAFGLPMIQNIKGREGTYGLVLAPSREIALQIHQFFEQFGAPFGVRTAVLIGGVGLRADDVALKSYPHIIVATPGRLCDHLERGNIWLEFIEMFVLDEADRMLDMGFSTQLNRIANELSLDRQTLLFSATFPKSVEVLAEKILWKPERIQVGKSVSAAKTVEQVFIKTTDHRKFYELENLLRQEQGTVFVFTRSKDGASQLWRNLHSRGFRDATQIHSNLKQSDRVQALEDFKSGKYRVLIATDVVGRGIHVDGVAHVVNYDLPKEPSDYVHRIGRTGRAEQTGKATTYITERDLRSLRDIEKVIGKKIVLQNPSKI